MSLENKLQDKTKKISTVKRNGTLLVKSHFFIKLVFYQKRLNLFASCFNVRNLSFI